MTAKSDTIAKNNTEIMETVSEKKPNIVDNNLDETREKTTNKNETDFENNDYTNVTDNHEAIDNDSDLIETAIKTVDTLNNDIINVKDPSDAVIDKTNTTIIVAIDFINDKTDLDKINEKRVDFTYKVVNKIGKPKETINGSKSIPVQDEYDFNLKKDGAHGNHDNSKKMLNDEIVDITGVLMEPPGRGSLWR